jgi:hypothetical protein
MRHVLGMALVFGLSLMACGGGDDSSLKPGAQGASPSGAPGQPGAPAQTAAGTPTASCPTGLVNPTLIATDAAEDLQVVGDQIFFRVDTAVSSMGKDGSKRTQVFQDPDLYSSFADASGILVVTAPNAPDATISWLGLDGTAVWTQNPTEWYAADTHVFGSDDSNLYVITNVSGQGDTIYGVDKATGNQTQLANFGDGEGNDISEPLLADENIWFVRASMRVYEVAQTPSTVDPTDPTAGNMAPGGTATMPTTTYTPQPATEIFASASQTCHLAVSDAAYCSDGSQLIRRDLTGANPTTIFDASKDADPTLGSLIAQGSVLVARPTDSTMVTQSPLGGVIRSVTPSTTSASEKIVACGRGDIAVVALDTTTAVWSETGATKGIYSAPR